ncbi:MAG: MerR family transcriptional regulator [Candidatus Omnitrophota bacterium]
MRTISQLAKQNQISRTALLYYDAMGLLKASRRTLSGYRLYDEDKGKRLESICLYRRAGLSLKDIKTLLGKKKSGSFAKVLEKRLSQINDEIQELKNQQRMILALLKNRRTLKMGKINKEQWIRIFRETGLSDRQMENWHNAFEKNSPEGHQEFLEFLNIPKEEIKAIRTRFGQ